jgi:hypothetical protein
MISTERSRGLLEAEVLLLMVPLCILLSIVSGLAMLEIFQPYQRPQKICLVLSVFSVVCLWRLVIRFFSKGGSGLRKVSRYWWAGAGFGSVIAIAACVSWLAPASPEYTPWAEFREDFNRLALGLPLLVPFVHLTCEAMCRRSEH